MGDGVGLLVSGGHHHWKMFGALFSSNNDSEYI